MPFRRLGIDGLNVALASTLAVFNFLSINSYPLRRLESLVLWALIWGALLLLLNLVSISKKAWLFYAGLLLLEIDGTLGLVQHLKSWGGWLAVATGIVFAAHLVRRKIKYIFLAGMAAGLSSAIFLHLFMPTHLFTSYEAPRGATASSESGNIYFFILDEHIGLANLPDGEFLAKTYRDNGFLVYPRAYSNYDTTTDSIPTYLNARIFHERRSGLRGKSLRTNRLFEKWSGEGRRIHVYQSTHLDFGHPDRARVGKTFTYRESSMGYIRDLPIPWHAKLKALGNNFIEDSRSLPLKKIRRMLLPRRAVRGSVTSGALAAGPILEEIKKDSLSSPAGGVFFAHFLSPHSSYFYDADCGFLDPARWESSHYDELDGLGTLNTDTDRVRRYALYWNQVRCLQRQLLAFFEFLRREGLYEQSALFITSDHGSRIYRTDMKSKYVDRLEPDDFRDGFSAFLAVKKEGAASGKIIEQSLPAAEAIRQVFKLDNELSAPKEELTKVYIQSDDFKRVMALEMPAMDTIDY